MKSMQATPSRARAADYTPARKPEAPQPRVKRDDAQASRSEGRCACGGGCPRCKAQFSTATAIQARSATVTASDDAYEQEADSIAQGVMRTSLPNMGTHVRKARATQSGAAPDAVTDILRMPGQPLDEDTRSFMEERLGTDLSEVRIHTGAAAGKSARAVNALAYTAGHHIVFGAGHYDPRSTGGRTLIAHELAHVLQQRGTGPSAGPAPVQRLAGPEITVSPQAVQQMHALLAEFRALTGSGAITAAETAEVTAAVAEAETALIAATEVAAAGTTAITVGDTALVATGALAADDVTGIGVADDVAIPFLLLGAAVAFGVGYVIGSSAADIAAAARRAVQAVARAIDAMRRAITRARPQPLPAPQPAPQPQPQPRPAPLPRPDVDTEPGEDEQRRGCRGQAVGQRGGNSCHDAFATLVSGVPREWGLETPSGLYAEFDALGHDRVLYEIKTGYRYLLGTTPSNYLLRERTINRFIAQSQMQLAVATRCGYPLVWVFNDPAVAAFVDGFIAAPVTSRPFQCDEDR
jgi:hypothetical protein